MICPGHVYYVQFGTNRYTEEQGRRPAICVSSDLHNQVNRSAIFVPLTRQTNKSHWHENVLVHLNGVPAVAMCAHVKECDVHFIEEEVATLEDVEFESILQTLKSVTLERR